MRKGFRRYDDNDSCHNWEDTATTKNSFHGRFSDLPLYYVIKGKEKRAEQNVIKKLLSSLNTSTDNVNLFLPFEFHTLKGCRNVIMLN